jgi:hypothetical protein
MGSFEIHWGYGNQNSVLKISRDLGLGKGSVPNYVIRAITPILKLRSGYASWPNPEEQINIAERIRKRCDIKTVLVLLMEHCFHLKPDLFMGSMAS